MKRLALTLSLLTFAACASEEPPEDYRLMCKQFAVALCNYGARCDETVQFGPCLAEIETELECVKVKGASASFDACLDATTRKQCTAVVQVDPACVGVFSY